MCSFTGAAEFFTFAKRALHSQHTNTQTVTPSTRHSHLAHITPALVLHGREEDFHRHNLFNCEFVPLGSREGTERPTARARSGSQSFHTELGGPPARRPAFKFSKEETRSRGESQRHPLRGHASVHVPLGAPVLVSVENIQSRGNRVGRKRTGGTDCVARRRDNCERTVSRSRLHEALRRRPMLCSGGHAQQVSYTYGVHGAW